MISAQFVNAARGARPRGAGFFPHALLATLACAPSFVACTSSDTQVTSPVVLGMSDQAPPSYSDENITLYTVQIPVQIPVRRPTDQERQSLGAAMPPYPRTPFIRVDDERLEVHFTLSNLDGKQHSVELLVDPWNEFVRYKPGVTVTENNSTPNFSGFDKFYILPPKGRVTGTLTNDDMHDLGIKLATVENILGQPPSGAMNANEMQTALVNRVFNIQNRTNTGDPLFSRYIPAVSAGLTGFDLGLRASEPVNIAVEITIDVTDVKGDRIVQPGSTDPTMAPPTTVLSPPGAR